MSAGSNVQVGRDRGERGPVGRHHIEAAHHHIEDRVARRLAGGAFGRTREHLVVDGAHERGDDLGL